MFIWSALLIGFYIDHRSNWLEWAINRSTFRPDDGANESQGITSTVETRHSKLWSALEEMSEDHQSGRVRPAVTTNVLFLLNEWHKELLSKTSPTREQPPERTRTQSAAEVKEYFIWEYVLITSPNEERTCLRLIQTETVLMMFTLNLSPVDK